MDMLPLYDINRLLCLAATIGNRHVDHVSSPHRNHFTDSSRGLGDRPDRVLSVLFHTAHPVRCGEAPPKPLLQHVPAFVVLLPADVRILRVLHLGEFGDQPRITVLPGVHTCQ
ncbi:Hypothetical predicted protein [Octopus vulgaris]|uniref:Uncharacterized protein n=1 Tax=Octopus vulgaris TaxID=6645 RepID=A0AA36BXG2_OCTVU|nr:Hypothetical predicted protein [Octopus vulgaris]